MNDLKGLVFEDKTMSMEEKPNVVNDSAMMNSSTDTKTKVQPQTEEEMRHCKLCNYQAQDWPTFSKHVFKPYHLRKIAESYNIRLSKETVSNIFTCDICAVECDGHQNWVAHLIGAKHRQTIDLLCIDKTQNKSGGPMRHNQSENWQNKKPYDRKTQPTTPAFAAQDFAEYSEPLIGLEYVTEIQTTGQLPCYRCSICEVKFEYNFKFPHLVGQKHRINVLKIKRPETLKGVNPTTMKRSEITVVLTREATRLEQVEGRKQAKTKVCNPSFTNNSQQSSTGRGGTRGGRGAIRGERGVTRGTTWSTRGGTEVRGAGKGNSGYTSRGTGRGNYGNSSRGTYNNRGMSQPRGRGFNMGSYQPGSAEHSAGSSSYNNDSFYNSYGKEPFGLTNDASFDNHGSYTQGQSCGPSQVYSGQTHSGSGRGYSAPPPQSQYPESKPIPSKEPDTPKTKEEVSAGLASALGDLTKLVQNEDDASVALHVSNALTQALLKYRMQGEIKDEK